MINSDLRAIFDELEEDTKLKALEFEKLFQNRCGQSCSSSVNSCSQTLPNIRCFSDFVVDKCEECHKDTPGIQLSDVSTVKLADVFYPPTSPNDDTVKEASCVTLKGESEFKVIRSSLDIIKWRYVGTYNGVWRSYPGVESCGAYDPRIRPWYVGAATGAKNVVLIMDVSGSMNEGGRLDIAKQAAKKVVDTLNNFDWVGLVSFSSSSNKYQDQLISVTNENKNQINDWIDDLDASGQTNFESAFQAGYSIINTSRGSEIGTGCETIIIFLTDGEVTEGEQDGDKLLNIISTLEEGNNTKILTYSLGTEADKTITKKIACQRNGLFQDIKFELDLQKAMNEYYLLLSAGIDRNQVIWTEPYEDFLGMGMITTVAYPIYDRTVNPPFLVGVIGQDVVMKELEKFANYDSILSSFITRSRVCNDFSLNECQMNSFRQLKCENISENCSPVRTSLQTCTNLGRVFLENTPLSTNLSNVEILCCGEDTCSSSTGAIIGGIVGGIVVILIIVGGIVWWCKNKGNTEENSNENKGKTKRVSQWERAAVQNDNQQQQPGEN